MLKIFNKNSLLKIYFSIIIFSLFTIWLNSYFLYNENLYRELLGMQLDSIKVNTILKDKGKYDFLVYPISVLLYTIKYFSISTVIFVAIVLVGYKVSFKQILRVVIISDLILVFPSIIKVLWFLFIIKDYQFNDLEFFYPLSLLNLLDATSMDKLWIYPFQLLNVFEIIYWIALAYGISKIINNNFDKALKVVLSSYIPALIIWVVFIMFLTVTLNSA